VLGTDTLKGYVVNPPIILDIKATDADAKVLANPSIRVKNHEKAKVHIGSKVPVITTTSTANVGVSSSVSYLDVGLKLDVEPTIYLRDQVAIKVGLDITNIISQVNVSGTIAYQLGTRSTATTLQLRDGETQALRFQARPEDALDFHQRERAPLSLVLLRAGHGRLQGVHLADGIVLECRGGDSHDQPWMALMRDWKIVFEAWIIWAQAW